MYPCAPDVFGWVNGDGKLGPTSSPLNIHAVAYPRKMDTGGEDSRLVPLKGDHVAIGRNHFARHRLFAAIKIGRYRHLQTRFEAVGGQENRLPYV